MATSDVVALQQEVESPHEAQRVHQGATHRPLQQVEVLRILVERRIEGAALAHDERVNVALDPVGGVRPHHLLGAPRRLVQQPDGPAARPPAGTARAPESAGTPTSGTTTDPPVTSSVATSTNSFATPRTTSGSTARIRVSAPCNDDQPGAARKNSSTARGIVLRTLGHSPGSSGLSSTLWITSNAIADTAPSTGRAQLGTRQLLKSGIRRGCPPGR